jgi:hypothetical protein
MEKIVRLLDLLLIFIPLLLLALIFTFVVLVFFEIRFLKLCLINNKN